MNTIFPKIVISDDGSSTLTHPVLGDSYHSTAGAVGEAMHVYIGNGLLEVAALKRSINVFEMGLGGGLNLLLTIQCAIDRGLTINYLAVEQYPVDLSVVEHLNYRNFVSPLAYDLFTAAHRAPWGEVVVLSPFFTIHKVDKPLQEVVFEDNSIDLVYFDAFAPDTQPELWSEEIFGAIFKALCFGGVLVTYSAKGVVKRALRAVGFEVKRRSGALGKHHQLFCTKQ